MARQITGPAIMIYQGEGKAPKPFARVKLQNDFHKITIPPASRRLGQRIFASALRDLSIAGERECGTNVIKKPRGFEGTVSITIDSDYKTEVNIRGVENRKHRKVVVILNPDCELFADKPAIRKSAMLDANGNSDTVRFTTAEVRECESIEVYIARAI
ncbi:hypothetical protein JW721_01220 [Candidatus Micrarchaeota archaeon]|nr:hypothetical protein [Candidatus Micrarchaeota archaeon]